MLSHIRTDEIRSLIRRLARSDQRNDQTVEMKSLFFELVLNVMMRMIAGKRFYGESVEDVEETVKFQEMVTDTFRLGGTTNISDFIPVLGSVMSRGYEKSLIELKEKRDWFMQRFIEENRRIASSESTSTSLSKENYKNMIQVLLSLQRSDPDYYTDEIIRGMMLVYILFKL